MLRAIGVLTSGGDAPGMNAAIRAVVRKGLFHGLRVVGVEKGFAGLLEGAFVELDARAVGDIIHRGGTVLRTARSQEFLTQEGQRRGLANLRRAGLEALVVIGGDGSFRAAAALADQGFPTVGIPGTIDNDVTGTELTIGFDTAVNTAVEAINKIRDTATSHERVFLVEVMGRESGFIALHAGIAGGAESILIPEVRYDLETVLEKMEQGRRRGKLHSIIVMAEGAGSALELRDSIRERSNLETRVTILGHLQRGGSPTALDRILASKLGAEAVTLLTTGIQNCMVGVQGGSLVHLSWAEAAKAEKRQLDLELYRLAGVLAT